MYQTTNKEQNYSITLKLVIVCDKNQYSVTSLVILCIFHCGQIGLDAPPTTWQYWKKLINVSLERLFNYVQWPHLKCKHVGRCTNNKFNCKSKWKPHRKHACNTLQAELDTWGYFCCQYAPTHKSPLLSLAIFTYSRGSLCKWVVSDEGLLQAIIILLYHYYF